MRGKIVGFQVIQGKSTDGHDFNGVTMCFNVQNVKFIGAKCITEYISASSPIYSRVQPLNESLIGKTCTIDYEPSGKDKKAVLCDILIDTK